MNYLEALGQKLRTEFEGQVPWIYLDTRGNPTTAVGYLMSSVEDAMSLPFLAGGNRAAGEAEIAAEYERVKAMPAGLVAKAYRSPQSPQLPPATVAELLEKSLAGYESQVEACFAGYAKYPEPARMALIDMAFNLGIHGLLKYVLLKAAAERGDWAEAARQCHRLGISEARNQWTKLQFLAAAKEPNLG